LENVDLLGTWGWSKLREDHHVDLHTDLVEFETTPIHDLKRAKRLKSIGVVSLERRAKDRLKTLDYWNEIDPLWELVLPSNRRVWGDLRQSMFYVLWWDPGHSVCTGNSRGAGRGRERKQGKSKP
jgi:hypothetical protein